MTRLVRDMEKSGLVSRRADVHDGRCVLVELTEKGRAVVDRVRKRKIALVATELEHLDAKSRQAMRIALDALRQ
jgi:DNA-binding MarR family transcriptional regulator